MQEWKLRVGTINAKLDVGDTVPVTIAVPKQFISLIEFVEEKLAADGGGKPRPAKKALNQLVLNELHNQLHWLVVAPTSFIYYRNLWNRFCDEQGAPEEKIADPEKPPSTPPKADDEVPF